MSGKQNISIYLHGVKEEIRLLESEIIRKAPSSFQFRTDLLALKEEARRLSDLSLSIDGILDRSRPTSGTMHCSASSSSSDLIRNIIHQITLLKRNVNWMKSLLVQDEKRSTRIFSSGLNVSSDSEDQRGLNNSPGSNYSSCGSTTSSYVYF